MTAFNIRDMILVVESSPLTYSMLAYYIWIIHWSVYLLKQLVDTSVDTYNNQMWL